MSQLPLLETGSELTLGAALELARQIRERRGREAAEAIAESAGFTLAELRGPSRTADRVAARQLIAVYLRGQGLSLPEIGRIIGRDHTTALHLLKKPRNEAADEARHG